ncbi:hypothetical protein [Trichodesmium erythraeum]
MAQHASYNRWSYNWVLNWWNVADKDGYQPLAIKLREVLTSHTKPLEP